MASEQRPKKKYWQKQENKIENNTMRMKYVYLVLCVSRNTRLFYATGKCVGGGCVCVCALYTSVVVGMLCECV